MIDGRAAAAALTSLASAFEAMVPQLMVDVADKAAEDARGTTLFKDRTGDLRRSIEPKAVGNASAVHAKAPYALFVEAGTKPHVIRAKGGGMLRFVMNGAVVFRRSVNHPGTTATNFMRHAQFAGAHYLATEIERRTAALVASYDGA